MTTLKLSKDFDSRIASAGAGADNRHLQFLLVLTGTRTMVPVLLVGT